MVSAATRAAYFCRSENYQKQLPDVSNKKIDWEALKSINVPLLVPNRITAAMTYPAQVVLDFVDPSRTPGALVLDV